MVEQLLENFDETLRNQTDIVMEMKPQGDRQGTGEREKYSHIGETDRNDCLGVIVREELDAGRVCELPETQACSHTFYQAQTCFHI